MESMKKIITISFMTLCLAACSEPEENKNNENGTTDKLIYEVTYAGGKENSDNFLFYDMKVSYKDADGNVVEEAVTEYPFTKTISGIEAPYTAEITPTYTLKDMEDIHSDKDRFTIVGLNMTISAVSSDGSIKNTTSSSSTMTLPLEKAYEAIKRDMEKNNGKTVSLKLE